MTSSEENRKILDSAEVIGTREILVWARKNRREEPYLRAVGEVADAVKMASDAFYYWGEEMGVEDVPLEALRQLRDSVTKTSRALIHLFAEKRRRDRAFAAMLDEEGTDER